MSFDVEENGERYYLFVEPILIFMDSATRAGAVSPEWWKDQAFQVVHEDPDLHLGGVQDMGRAVYHSATRLLDRCGLKHHSNSYYSLNHGLDPAISIYSDVREKVLEHMQAIDPDFKCSFEDLVRVHFPSDEESTHPLKQRKKKNKVKVVEQAAKRQKVAHAAALGMNTSSIDKKWMRVKLVLRSHAKSRGAKEPDLTTWTLQAVPRASGQSEGSVDYYFYNPDGMRFRSVKEIAKFFFP